jgi:hypothetical protein
MFIGRLPVYDVYDADTIVDKIISYENSGPAGWNKAVTLVADNLDDRIYADMSEALTGYLLPGSYQVNRIYLAGDNRNLSACRADILSAFNDGSLIINYIGHGSVDRWAHESLFTNANIHSLNNAGRLPFVITMTCAAGYFVYPPGYYNCMAEELLYASNGGAVAVLAPSGISCPDIQQLLNEGIFESIFIDGDLSVGEAVTKGKIRVFENAGNNAENVIQTFTLFSDPALKLKKGTVPFLVK